MRRGIRIITALLLTLGYAEVLASITIILTNIESNIIMNVGLFFAYAIISIPTIKSLIRLLDYLIEFDENSENDKEYQERIYKYDFLKNLLILTEVFALPMGIWKCIIQKNYFNYTIIAGMIIMVCIIILTKMNKNEN